MERAAPGPKMAAIALSIALLSGLGGCGTTDRMKVSSIPTDDYRIRHPIVIAEAAQTLDLFPSGGGRVLDERSAAQVREYAARYRAFGHGPIDVFVPTGPHTAASRGTVEAIRNVLAAGGVRAPASVMTYPVTDPALASPVRLRFVAIKAKVANRCGEWPRDLGSGSSVDGWQNKTYWNYGCAYQTAIAAQVADPRDLVTPQAEGPTDTLRRSRAIVSVRKGTDPNTDWKIKNTSISSVGAN